MAEEKGGEEENGALAAAAKKVIGKASNSSAVNKISVDITAVLGTAEMKVANLLKIGRGARLMVPWPCRLSGVNDMLRARNRNRSSLPIWSPKAPGAL